MEVSPCRNPTAPSVSTTARITSNSVKISTTWSAVDTAPSPERSTGMPMRRSAPTFSRSHQRPQNQQLQSNRSILQGYPGTGVPAGIVIPCRTFLLAFSIQPCYNAPRCRVRISAIIVASQARVVLDWKSLHPNDFSDFENGISENVMLFVTLSKYFAGLV